ncbi:hypothetical protein PanWU01x14_241830 [Parasponia andersonii]|uniref:Uncharacterized protein n=1 Tax=Parasponia andersonii TaxID=3476 RepID=A0A2P5BG61_PARAD|nr:hypothetical protein PanWU01x14_241830 [Parasponia andersonii]
MDKRVFGESETANWVASGLPECGRSRTFSGKLSLALLPLKRRAASSYALAAPSAVSNVPSQTLAALKGSLISAAHFPHGLCLTPLYFLLGCSCGCRWVISWYSYVGVNDVVCGGGTMVAVNIYEVSAPVHKGRKNNKSVTHFDVEMR